MKKHTNLLAAAAVAALALGNSNAIAGNCSSNAAHKDGAKAQNAAAVPTAPQAISPWPRPPASRR